MPRTKDQRLKLALLLQQWLDKRNHRPRQERQAAFDAVIDQAKALSRSVSLIELAMKRQWSLAAAVAEKRAAALLRQLQCLTAHPALPITNESMGVTLSLRDLYLELLQLSDEFDQVTFDAKNGLITAETDSIELEEVPLGAFRIELHLDRMEHTSNVSVFDIVALQPNSAEGSEETTHPHVRDNQLCAGDATVPVRRALEQGRISDAFMAIRSVLNTYNESSPFISLSNWTGQPCDDCGCRIDDDHRSGCEGCDRSFCEDCTSVCDVCESSFCLNCLEQDTQSGRSCCRSCRRRCGQCRRIVDADSFVEDTGLCPGCDEAQLKLLEKETDDEPNDSETGEPDPGSSVESPATAEILQKTQTPSADVRAPGVAEAAAVPACR